MDETTDALDLLMNDHRLVEQLFEEYEQLAEDEGDATEKQSLAATICAELTVHAQLEEEIFYPAARNVLDDQELLDQAEAEHASAKELIAQLEETSPDDDMYDAKVKLLSEQIALHVHEEENELFPQLRDAGLETETLGQQMLARKAEILDEMGIVETEEE